MMIQLTYRRTVIAGFCLLGLTVLVFLAFYSPLTVPAEDAVILHQYSRNLAETGAISYIPHGSPAEGATDFLWMVYIAIMMKSSLSPAMATALANMVSAVGISMIALRLAKSHFYLVKLLSVVSVLAFIPQLEGAARGFSVLPFCALILLTVMYAEEEHDALTACSALVLCLFRPDGVVFAIPTICVMRLASKKDIFRRVGVYALLFVIPGLGYFVWRAHYFHELLPLPFLVKSNNHRYLGLFVMSSLRSLAPYLIFDIVVLSTMLGKTLFKAPNIRVVVVLLIIPTAFYANIRLEQNLNDRFFIFYPACLFFLIAVNWKMVIAQFSKWKGGLLVFAYLVLLAFPTLKSIAGAIVYRDEWARLRNLGDGLSVPEIRGTMLTSESGIIPYFSRWRAYDSWGLNTAEFSRRVIQPWQVVRLHPDLIILHGADGARSCSVAVRPAIEDRDWTSMKLNVQTGIALMGNYEIWQVPYWPPSKQDRMVRVQHLEPDMQCWYISSNYGGRYFIEQLLPRYQGSRMDMRTNH